MLANPEVFLAFLVALLVSVTVHEFAHAFAADRLGDPTPRLMRRVTLNPLRHLDPMGTIMMIVVALVGVGIGWGKPVPFNPTNLRIGPKRGAALVAFAGPASNLLLAAVIGRMLSLDLVGGNPFDPSLVAILLSVGLVVNVTLAVFNLLPIPPLDGFRVLLGILPDRPAYLLARLEPYGAGILLLLVVFGLNILGPVLQGVSGPIIALLTI